MEPGEGNPEQPGKFGISLLVANGSIVTPHGQVTGDLLVVDGKVAGIDRAGSASQADEVIDARGMYVLPGLVDAHVHVREPGLIHKEDFASATRAAAAGGVTTILVMPFDRPIASSGDIVQANARLGLNVALVDFGMSGAAGPDSIDSIAGIAHSGALSVEVMLADAPEELGSPSPAELRRIQAAAHAHRLPVGVYCDEPSISDHARRKVVADGRKDAAAFLDSKPPVAEAIAAALACEVALDTGSAVHLRQLSTRASVEVAAAAKARGADMTVEVTPHHLSLSAADAEAGGPDLKVAPPLRSKSDLEALHAAVMRGDVDVVATDHAPHARSEKLAGADDIWAAPGGFPGLETLLPLLFELFGRQAPELVARLCAEAPARRFGLADRKGSLRVGADADIVIFDPSTPWVVDSEQLYTRAKSSPFEGHRFAGSVRYTVLGGEVIARDRALDEHPRGRWLTRG